MLWLITAILAYLFLAAASLADRYLLAGPMPNPKILTFLVGSLGMLSLILVPFGFSIPAPQQIYLNLFTGTIWTVAIFLLYSSISQSEVSTAIPAIGGFLPIFTLIISSFFFPATRREINPSYFLALFLLIIGGLLISLEKGKRPTIRNLSLFVLTAFFFGLGFSLTKLVYLKQPFISGFIWIRIGGALASSFFLLSPAVRQFIFNKKTVAQAKVSLPFLLGQACGGLGVFLQNYSVALAQVNQVPLINALEGTRYIFLLFLIFALSRKYPHLLKEEVSPKVLTQKIAAILLISAGLVFLII